MSTAPSRLRARPKAMTLTDAAANRLRMLAARAENPILGLRVGIKKGGCAGMEYTLEEATELKPGDEVVEDKGAKIFIDPAAILFLLGTEMDYQTSLLSSGFTFKNPNQKSACGCGESVNLAPAEMEA
ncbi:iron-sulfur cluster assembly protein [Rhodoligotrophos appendicifer]|uniref:HesB/IscA family protein n=1 Tax=Rhodoligotrophos appendicifer TaxID=987056 RepID=UPI0011861597|nr:iron-sulfur cluster assembly accessory protein [Rhodoligotrophos appendicifer]